MNAPRAVMRALLGRRLPTTRGRLGLDGIEAEVTVRRDSYGIPHIEAGSDADAWFGLGFCQGQDRSFQLEMLMRLARGSLAELVGQDAVPIDRLTRRIGFRRAGEAQVNVLDPDVRRMVEGYARGVNAGRAKGSRRAPHEFTLLRARPTPFEPADVLAIGGLQGFFLTIWDAQLARMKILALDGADALVALDPSYLDWLPVTAPPGTRAGKSIEGLEADLDAFARAVGRGGGSNNWAIAATRTATGRPIFANDPHLVATHPPHWYAAHIRTPRWEAAGMSLVGLPGFPAGHNDVAAWGITAGLVHNTDLALEEIGSDGHSVRRGDRFASCEVRREMINVRKGDPVVEEVLVTPEGPIIGPALEGETGAVSIRATWLQPRRVRATLGFHSVRTFEDLRRCCADFPLAALNVAYADCSGTIGWQLAGDAPRRKAGHGAFPFDAADPDAGWDGIVDFEQMPHAVNPPTGWIASANNKPVVDDGGPFLGRDWIDGYRVAAIGEALDARADWDLASTQMLQIDVASLPWRDIRDVVLGVPVFDEDAISAMSLLASWDGRLTAESAAASVFEFFVAEMTRRVVVAKAPKSAEWVLGETFTPLLPHNGFWRSGTLIRLLCDQPVGWFARGWPAEIADALRAAMVRLRTYGEGEAAWAWGRIRPLTLRHPMAGRRPLDRIFNIGPIPWGGDNNTISQAGITRDPTGPVGWMASMRMVVDVGGWSASRFSLPGGQSGNPLSPHYDDLLEHWKKGTGVPIAWTAEEVTAATVDTLRLVPARTP